LGREWEEKSKRLVNTVARGAPSSEKAGQGVEKREGGGRGVYAGNLKEKEGKRQQEFIDCLAGCK